tara:strand:+ start:787 stop:1155 length:369 start_codon:yes stop_codon:yes gene_type:complete
MKYVEKYSKNDDKQKSDTKSYGVYGEVLQDQEQGVSNPKDQDSIVYAKYKFIDLGEKVQKKFFVLTSNGNLLDPRGTDSHRIKTINKELKTTSKQTFDYYIKYLQSKNTLFLRRAERSFING